MKGYKEKRKEYIALLKKHRYSTKEIRALLKSFDEAYAEETGEMPHWFEGMPPFREPEYRVHPLMGHQVKSRHHFEPPGSTREERLAEKKTIGRIKPTLKPYEADPDYHDPMEPVHGSADLQGVKQCTVSLIEEGQSTLVEFKTKSARLLRSIQVLELKVGYDHKTNKHVLYSPLRYNERWDRQSQVIWLRIIGMTPKRIGKRLDIKYDCRHCIYSVYNHNSMRLYDYTTIRNLDACTGCFSMDVDALKSV